MQKHWLIGWQKGMIERMDKYLYWLDCIEGLGTKSKRNLIEAFGSAEEVFYAPEKLVQYILESKKMTKFMEARAGTNIDRGYEALLQKNIRFVSCFESVFPEKLKVIPDEPFMIYYKGKLPEESIPSVAIIGARECSAYGEFIAKELGASLGEQGIQVISGMAKGIDGISQMKAVEAGGSSYAVLGCGVDVCYPKSNQKLYEDLIDKGGIMSTYPPGTTPQARLFPSRNRIVSGLADVLVVIEARRRSGTSITVEMALEQGKDIFAVPGRVTDRLSDGCNKMIKEGAHVFLSPEDFLLDLQELLPAKMTELKLRTCKRWMNTEDNISEENTEAEDENRTDDFTEKILSVLDFYPQALEKIAMVLKERFNLEIKQEEITSKMMYLSILGIVKQDSQGWYSKISKI